MSLDLPELGPRERSPLLTPEDVGESILRGLQRARTGTIDVGDNPFEFVQKYDLKFDGRPIAGPEGLGRDYRHLVPLYEDVSRQQVLMAAAQSGKSLWAMVFFAWNALGRLWGKQLGYYFPVYDLLTKFSDTRFRPFLKSNPVTGKLVGAPVRNEDGTARKGKDATESMSLGESFLHFLLTTGVASTEGMPLAAVFFDEVRRMAMGDIERAQKRSRAQRDRIDVKVSTPRYPEKDIHHFFRLGDQRWFHTECDCVDGVVLARSFPDCVADLTHATPALLDKVAHAYHEAGLPLYGFYTADDAAQYPRAVYRCPRCGKIIADPREGWWEAEEPGRYIRSWQMPQMLTVHSPAGRTLQEFERAKDVQEFYNSELGIPFVDRTKMPVQHSHIDACIDGAIPWGFELTAEKRRRQLSNCAMGIDVQGGWGVCVVKKLQPNGKARVVHVELLEGFTEGGTSRSWWHRAAQLMVLFDVRICVVDSAPEFVPSLFFVNQFPGRAFLARFKEMQAGNGIVQWDDVTLDNDAKQEGETAVRHMVSLDRTRVIEWSLKRWTSRQMELPNPSRLQQRLPQDSKREVVFSEHMRLGERAEYPVAMLLREQLTRYVFRDLVTEDPDATPEAKRKAEVLHLRGKTRRVAEATGRDDFAMADMYCNVALDRMGLPTRRGPE